MKKLQHLQITCLQKIYQYGTLHVPTSEKAFSVALSSGGALGSLQPDQRRCHEVVLVGVRRARV